MSAESPSDADSIIKTNVEDEDVTKGGTKDSTKDGNNEEEESPKTIDLADNTNSDLKIKFIMTACGDYHNLAIDSNGQYIYLNNCGLV